MGSIWVPKNRGFAVNSAKISGKEITLVFVDSEDEEKDELGYIDFRYRPEKKPRRGSREGMTGKK